MYVRLVKCEPAKEAGDFSNQPAFFQICRLKAGSRLSWKALDTTNIFTAVLSLQGFENKDLESTCTGHSGR